MRNVLCGLLFVGCAFLVVADHCVAGEDYFRIRVVDDATGRGVPLVELMTVNGIRMWTDSAGVVAFYEPGLMDREVFFYVKSHGYDFAKDGFGMVGKRLNTEPGGNATLKIHRVNIAERLYRLTGGGIYRDSVLLGLPVPLREPLLNGQVLGCDSVQTAVFQNRVYWFWGDTNWPRYPLGNFKMTGATTPLPGPGGLDPDKGVDFDYFLAENGFVKKMVSWESKGPTWISGPIVLGEGSGERMFAHYQDIQGGGTKFGTVAQGLAEFDKETNEFRRTAEFPMGGPFPHGAHPVIHEDDGKRYVYFCDPFPQVRAEATAEALADFSSYEAYTCLKQGTKLADEELDRDAEGTVRWSWKQNTDAVRPQEQEKLVRRKKLRREDAILTLRDIETGDVVVAHRGSVAYNAYRKRWIMVLGQIFGSPSSLGEIWYAEADSLTGPWSRARKIVTHDNYTFYNPRHHPMLDAEGGRIIYFEGTYTATFSGNDDKTPRYDYNQVMYRLDLADPRLAEL